MDEEKDKNNSYNQDLILENKTILNKIYNYFYIMLKDKNEISFLEIYILYVLEAIQLISYGLSAIVILSVPIFIIKYILSYMRIKPNRNI